MKLRLLYVTARDKDEALALSRGLVATKLVACVNILESMTSVYLWQGEIEENSEVLMLIKTVKENVSAVENFLRTHHSYKIPCIVSIPIESGNEDFVKWVENSCKVTY
jgi:periplasmic divalent cation tolerance protein